MPHAPRLKHAILQLLIPAAAWFAVIAQFVLMMDNRTTSVAEMVIRFFSFFTILTNTLVAIYFTHRAIGQKGLRLRLLDAEGMLTAVTGYIFVVGLVYQVALRHIWQPTGLQMVVDELLHTVIPMLVLVYWVLHVERAELSWKHIPRYLIYPVVYLVYILLRGALSGFYPYPFIDVGALGLTQTLLNAIVLLVVFVVLFAGMIGVGRRVRR